MHQAPLAPIPALVLTDCWTGLAPLVHFDRQPTPPPAQAGRTLAAVTARLRQLLRLSA